MAALSEIAAEYRRAAAKLAMSIDQHKKAGDLDPDSLRVLMQALRDTREVAQLLSGYYDTPRPPGACTLVGLKARRSRDDH